MLLDYMSEGV